MNPCSRLTMAARAAALAIVAGVLCACTHGAPAMDPRGAPDHPQWRVRLSWRTETESKSFAFFVYRSEAADGEGVCLNEDAPLDAAGTTVTPHEYVYYDLTVQEGRTYYYKLEQVDLDGAATWLVGDPAPVQATPKALSEEERLEIRDFGPAYRIEAGFLSARE